MKTPKTPKPPARRPNKDPGEPASSMERPVHASHAIANFGPRLRSLRRLKQLTLEELATAVNVGKAHISRLERGLKAPSIAVMAKLATTLETSIGHLVGETLDRTEIKVTRYGDLQPQRSDGSRDFYFAPLLHGRSADSFEAFVIYPGLSSDGIHAEHTGQEMLFVLSGVIDVVVAGHTERLAAGDCIHFPAYLTHSSTRVGKEEARALVVLSAR